MEISAASSRHRSRWIVGAEIGALLLRVWLVRLLALLILLLEGSLVLSLHYARRSRRAGVFVLGAERSILVGFVVCAVQRSLSEVA